MIKYITKYGLHTKDVHQLRGYSDHFKPVYAQALKTLLTHKNPPPPTIEYDATYGVRYTPEYWQLLIKFRDEEMPDMSHGSLKNYYRWINGKIFSTPVERLQRRQRAHQLHQPIETKNYAST